MRIGVSKSFCWGMVATATILFAVMLGMLNLKYGNLNQDEGWYLYAAKSVAEGKALYSDFAFTQGPMLPKVYGVLYATVLHFGVTGGRFVTFLFGLLSSFFVGWVVFRESEKRSAIAAAVGAFLLISCNVYHSYFTTIVKTYALCSFFLAGGILALSYRRYWVGCVLAGVLLACAAGTRLSAGIVLPVAGVWLIYQQSNRWGWLWFGLGGGLTLLIVFGPSFFHAFDQTTFGLFYYHAGRDSGSIGTQLVLKAGFISRFVQNYFLFTLLMLSILLIPASRSWRINWRSFSVLLWGGGIAISAVHFIAPFPYDDYQVIAFPLLAGALALSLFKHVDASRMIACLTFLLLVSVASAFSSSINQDWFIRGRDRIWWQFKEKSDLQRLQEAAKYVREHSPENSVLLTQDTYLAIEANRTVPPGMEMGPFCYYPEMSCEKAEKLHLLNRQLLIETLKTTDAPVAAFSGYSLSIQSPSITEIPPAEQSAYQLLIEQRYNRLGSLSHFGQAHTTLHLFTLKDGE